MKVIPNVGFDKTYTLEHSHKLSHEIEDMLISKLDGVQEVIVHIEPADVFNSPNNENF